MKEKCPNKVQEMNKKYFIIFPFLFFVACPESKEITSIEIFQSYNCEAEFGDWGYPESCGCEKTKFHYDTRIGSCLERKDFGVIKKISGVMQSGMMSIGGETTGYHLKAKDGSYDLYLKKEDKKKAMAFNNKVVSLEAYYFMIKGVERRERKALIVYSF